MLLTYEFTDGTDLDTRTRMVSPDVGQNAQSNYVGWSCETQWPSAGPGYLPSNETPYLIWGGDNQGTGLESVLFDVNVFKTKYPSSSDIILDMRAFWFSTVGINPVNVAATLWSGGTPTKSGFSWNNPTASASYIIESVGKVVTSQGLPSKTVTAGERIATMKYNVVSGAGLFDSNDITTPAVGDGTPPPPLPSFI